MTTVLYCFWHRTKCYSEGIAVAPKRPWKCTFKICKGETDIALGRRFKREHDFSELVKKIALKKVGPAFSFAWCEQGFSWFRISRRTNGLMEIFKWRTFKNNFKKYFALDDFHTFTISIFRSYCDVMLHNLHNFVQYDVTDAGNQHAHVTSRCS